MLSKHSPLYLLRSSARRPSHQLSYVEIGAIIDMSKLGYRKGGYKEFYRALVKHFSKDTILNVVGAWVYFTKQN
jgi:hypothetical protein